MIKRILQKTILSNLSLKKAILIFGPRQTGKTTLLKQMFDGKRSDILWINADKIADRLLLEQESFQNFISFLADKKYLIIDEAQRIENIGLKLKIIFDETDINIIATGSSSFDLAGKINEPLTGRKLQYKLYPFSFEELAKEFGVFEEYKNLTARLIYGSYPDVVIQQGHRQELLQNLASSYLYKDVLEWDLIKNSDRLLKLLKALAFQVGSQISYNEIGQLIGASSKTVENYIDILEKCFVIFKLQGFSRNHRNELKKTKKIYFYDNGIRNVLINNFNFPDTRNDMGILWENYIISERIKYTDYHQIYTNRYFWRTKNKQEIDYIEERDGKLYAYEFKWSKHKKVKIPQSFLQAYPDAETKIITPDNYIEFITGEK